MKLKKFKRDTLDYRDGWVSWLYNFNHPQSRRPCFAPRSTSDSSASDMTTHSDSDFLRGHSFNRGRAIHRNRSKCRRGKRSSRQTMIQHQTGYPDDSHRLAFNLSDFSLTASETSALNKGLSYVPTFFSRFFSD